MTNLQDNKMITIALVMLALFLMYSLLCKNNKTMGGAEEDKPVVDETGENLESDSELLFNDPDYNDYEPVMDNEVSNMQKDVMDVQPNNQNMDVDIASDMPSDMQSNMQSEQAQENVPEELNKNEFAVEGMGASFDNYYMLDSVAEPSANQKNEKLNPSDLLPKDSKNMEGNNFLTAALSKNEQIIGIPTQTQRARKNYDLRSAPANPQVEVSPWNMSTMEPDTGRLSFEIGQPVNLCE